LGHSLAGVVVLGGQLDLMILEVFSDLNDSTILCRTVGIQVHKPGRQQAHSRNAAGAYASENQTVRDFYPGQLLPSTSTGLLHGSASASLSELSDSCAGWSTPVLTRQT